MPATASTATTARVIQSQRRDFCSGSSSSPGVAVSTAVPGLVGAHAGASPGMIWVAAASGPSTCVAAPAPSAAAATAGADTCPPRAAASRSARNSAAEE
ncbi:hypothetical protein D3C74_451840 [compost metagenome]